MSDARSLKHYAVGTMMAVASVSAMFPALAHETGDAAATQGFLAGFMHPLSGIDHLLLMLSLGAHAAARPRTHVRRFVWMTLGTFVAALLAGAVAGAAGVRVPMLEPMLATSLLLAGLLLVMCVRLSATTAGLLFAGASFLHGLAHGAELGAGVPALSGITVSSILLVTLGATVGLLLRGRRGAIRLAGAPALLCGAALLVLAVQVG